MIFAMNALLFPQETSDSWYSWQKKINLKGNEVAQVNFVQATKMVGNLHSYLTL